MTIVDNLNAKRATPETILEAMKISVVEVSDYKAEDKMRDEMLHATDEAQLTHALKELERNRELMDEAALAWIAVAAADPSKQQVVEGAIQDADKHAPLAETALLAVIALYAIYLLANRDHLPPLVEENTKIEYNDGTYTTTTQKVYASFSDPLKAIFNLFKSSLEISGTGDGSN